MPDRLGPPDRRAGEVLERLGAIAQDLSLQPPSDPLDGPAVERFVLEVQKATRDLWNAHLRELLADRIRLLRASLDGGDGPGIALHSQRLAELVEQETRGPPVRDPRSR